MSFCKRLFGGVIRCIGKVVSFFCSFKILFVAGAWCIFYATTWEHLNVGKMRFQSGLSNPTESLTLICIVFLLVGFYPEFWCMLISKLCLNQM